MVWRWAWSPWRLRCNTGDSSKRNRGHVMTQRRVDGGQEGGAGVSDKWENNSVLLCPGPSITA